MNEQSAIDEAAAWYVGVLEAVKIALLGTASIGRLEQAAPAFVAALARQGYSIEPIDVSSGASVAGEAHSNGN